MIPTPVSGICGIMPLQFAGAFPRRRPDSVGHGSLAQTRSLHHPLRPMGLCEYIKSTDLGRLLPWTAQSGQSVLAYNLNNVCNAGASPVPSPVGSAPRFSGERTNNQLQGYYNTIYCGCQQVIFCMLYFRRVTHREEQREQQPSRAQDMER